MAKTNILKDLDISEVSLVDVPANERARVVIHKRATRKMECECGEEDEADEDMEPVEMKCKKCGKPMTLAKGLPTPGQMHTNKPLGEEDEDKAKDLAGMKKPTKKAAKPAEEENMEEITKLQAELDAVKSANVDLQKRLDAYENAPEMVEKRALAALPESIRKRLESAEQELKKMAEEKSEAEMIAKVGVIKGVNAKEIGPVLKSLAPEQSEVILKTLRALAEQVSTGDLFKVAGSDQNSGLSNEAGDIMKRAEGIAKEEKIDVAAAMAKLFASDPNAYDEYRRSVTVRAGR